MRTQLLILVLLFVNSTFAQSAPSTEREIELSLTRASFDNYETNKKRTDTVLYTGYHQKWIDILQWGIEGGVLSVPDGSDNKSVLALMGVLTQNIHDDILNGPFIQLGAGLYPAYDETEFESEFSYFGGLGYRLDVLNRITYKPYLRIWQRGSEDRLRYELQALNFSFFF